MHSMVLAICTLHGTLISGDLISPGSISITFGPDSNDTLCATLQTNDDQILERNETFPFSLLSGDEAITEIQPDMGEITILDNDSEFTMSQ